MDKILEEIEKIGIVPVIVIDRTEDAVPLARALCEGGLPAAEVTFRTAAAKDAIAAIRREFPEMIVGAGTVLTTEQADEAIESGAQFVVSPGLNPEVVKHCMNRGVTMLPGCSSPTDIEKAMSLGLSEVKFFPSEQIGGLPAIKAMSAPYGRVRFMPTGGLNAKNMSAYLAEPKIIACGGSFMVTKELISAGNFDRVRQLTEEAVKLMLGLTFAGLLTENGRELAVMETKNIKRAVYHLERKGVRFDEGSAETADGRLVRIDAASVGMRLAEKRGGA